MDPLSEVLSLLKLKTYVSGGFGVDADSGLQFGSFKGMKCYAIVSGTSWVSVEGVPDAVHLRTGDCILLPRGLPFALATDLAAPRINFSPELTRQMPPTATYAGAYVLGAHFLLTGDQSEVLLHSLPALVVIKREASRRVMRWSLECLREELCDPQPGGALIAQQLAYIMMVQALRVHLHEQGAQGVGWLFALADPAMRTIITWMHDDPGHPWTLQEFANRIGMSRTIFAHRFRQKVGMTPMEYLTRWRMMVAADRLRNKERSVSAVASSVGYKTDSAFGRAFKKIWGYSPRQHWRLGGGSSEPDEP